MEPRLAKEAAIWASAWELLILLAVVKRVAPWLSDLSPDLPGTERTE